MLKLRPGDGQIILLWSHLLVSANVYSGLLTWGLGTVVIFGAFALCGYNLTSVSGLSPFSLYVVPTLCCPSESPGEF